MKRQTIFKDLPFVIVFNRVSKNNLKDYFTDTILFMFEKIDVNPYMFR